MSRADPVIPLGRTSTGRLLLWALAGIVYLAVIAFAVAGATHQLLNAAAENANVAIVSLPAPLDQARAAGDLAGVTALLLADPDVVRVDRLAPEDVGQLLGIEDDPSLPLPGLLELRFRPALEPDFDRMNDLVRTIVSDGAVVDAGKAGGARIDVAFGLRLSGAVAGVLLVVLTGVLVAAVTHAAVRQHDATVDLLRLLGAPDRFVAGQFQRHVASISWRSGLVGFVAAAATLVAIVDAGQLTELPGVDRLMSMPLPWAILACVPLALVAISTLVARITAGWTLRQMP